MIGFYYIKVICNLLFLFDRRQKCNSTDVDPAAVILNVLATLTFVNSAAASGS